MSAVLELNKVIARRFFLELHGRNYEAVADEVLDQDIVFTGPAVPEGANPGREGFKAMMARFETAFPDRTLTIDDMVGEGDMVAARWTFSGTHRGTLMSIPPSGKFTAWTGVSFIRIAGGKVVRDWAISDRASMLRQLGLLPQSAEGAVRASFLSVSANSMQSPGKIEAKEVTPSSSDQNKAISSEYLAKLHSKDYAAAADQILGTDYVVRGPAVPADTRPGREGFKQLMVRYQAAFHDQKVVVDEQVAEGDKVATRWTFRAIHKGQLEGIRPTGKHVAWTGVSIQRIVDGKIVESWAIADSLGRLQQLGVIPAP